MENRVYVVINGNECNPKVWAHRDSIAGPLGDFLVWYGGWRWVSVTDCHMRSIQNRKRDIERQARRR